MTEAAPRQTTGLRAMILAAGYGTRLAPVTDHLPKPLLPVDGEPLLDHIIERVLAAGAARIAVNSHHLGALVTAHLAAHPRSECLVSCPEAEILGTGGALANARDFLAAGPHFLLHNGDVLCDADLGQLVARHVASGARATLLLVDWPAVNSVTVGPDGAVRHFGGVGEPPPPRADDRRLTYAGIGVFARECLDAIGPGFSSLITPLAAALRQAPGSVRGVALRSGSWDDLGTLARWLQAAGKDARTGDGFEMTRLTGHGSDRRFWRLGRDGWSAVAMVSPPDDPEFERFVAIGRFLHDHHLGAPRLQTVSAAEHSVLMEDVGTGSLHALAHDPRTPQPQVAAAYVRVVDHLLALQRATAQAEQECLPAVDRVLDRDALRGETAYFQERFLAGHLGLSAAAVSPLAAEFAALADWVAAMPRTLIHRDFQSQNILLQNGRVRLVDFQGMRLGPLSYDLASLVWDPYVQLGAGLRVELVERYAAGQSRVAPAHVAGLVVAAGLQRVMQALGAFGFLGHVKGKPEFLAHIPSGVRHLRLLLTDLAAGDRPDHWPAPMPRLTQLVADLAADDFPPESGGDHD